MSGLYNLVTAQSHRLTHGFIEGLKEMQLKREQRERGVPWCRERESKSYKTCPTEREQDASM